MSAKTRIIAFVLGLVFTIAGAILTYFEFFGKGDQWYTDTSYFSYGTFIIGIVLLLIAFEKKKKEPEQKTDSSEKAGA